MISAGSVVSASAGCGAKGPLGPVETATGPLSGGPVPGPREVPELLMKTTFTFESAAPDGRSIENRTQREPPVQSSDEPWRPIRASGDPGSATSSVSSCLGRP